MENESNQFKLSDDKRDALIKEIKAFFLDERGEEIGDLQADIFLDFVTSKIAREFYNKGIDDAYRYMSDRLQDLFEIKKITEYEGYLQKNLAIGKTILQEGTLYGYRAHRVDDERCHDCLQEGKD